MTNVLTQDLRLLDILEALPSAEEPDTQALRERLARLCEAQSLADVPPERIDQAVAQYLGRRVPLEPFKPWKRPDSLEHWQSVKDHLAARAELLRRAPGQLFRRLSGLVAGLTCAAAGLGVLFHPAHQSWMGFFTLVSVVFIVTAGLSAFLGSLWIDEGGPDYRRHKEFSRQWLRSDAIFGWMTDAWQWAEADPDLKRMGKWLASPEAVEALKALRLSHVPITNRDAVELDELTTQTVDRLHRESREARAEEWNRTLNQLEASSESKGDHLSIALTDPLASG